MYCIAILNYYYSGNRKGKYTKRLEKEKQSERELKAFKLQERMTLEHTRLAGAAATVASDSKFFQVI
jgi:hypothetical protein